MDIIQWLKQEPVLFQEYVLHAAFVLLFATIMVGIGFMQLGLKVGDAMLRPSKAVADHSAIGAGYKVCVFALGEEAVYRYLVLSLAVYFAQADWQVFAALTVSSCIFGFAPPHSALPIRTRIAIAFGGVGLSLIYLKCGGWRGGDPLKPLLFSAGGHVWACWLIALAWRYR